MTYPGLPDDPYHKLAEKYLPDGTCGVISISIKGGREAAVRFMDALQLASIEVHVADIRTCVLHPASATHRQLTEEQLKAAGIDGGLIDPHFRRSGKHRRYHRRPETGAGTGLIFATLKIFAA